MSKYILPVNKDSIKKKRREKAKDNIAIEKSVTELVQARASK